MSNGTNNEENELKTPKQWSSFYFLELLLNKKKSGTCDFGCSSRPIIIITRRYKNNYLLYV